MMRHKTGFFALICAVLTVFFGGNVFASTLDTLDATAAPVLVYVDTPQDADFNASELADNFLKHLDIITNSNVNVISLNDILSAQKDRTRIPPPTIAITFDNPHLDFFNKIWPQILDQKIPITLFITPDYIDQEKNDGFTWEELRKIQKNPHLDIGLTLYGAVTEVRLNSARARLREELDITPTLFAYGAGIYNEEIVTALKNAGFTAAFGQHSGVTSYLSDPYRLPRFTLTNDFADTERFQIASTALPLPAHDIQPRDNLVTGSSITAGFTLDGISSKNLSCFSSETGKITPVILEKNRIEIRVNEEISSTKLRINCTIPVASEIADEPTRYRWLGFFFSFPEKTELQNIQPNDATGLEP